MSRTLGDAALDARARLSGADARLDELAARGPARDVLVLSVYRPSTDCLPGAVKELLRSRHRVALALGSTGGPAPALAAHTQASNLEGGKFQNLNALLELVAEPPPRLAARGR